MTFQSDMSEWMHEHYPPISNHERVEVSEPTWEEIAQDPNAVKWDEKQIADLEKLVLEVRRLQEENVTLRAQFLPTEVWTITEYDPRHGSRLRVICATEEIARTAGLWDVARQGLIYSGTRDPSDDQIDAVVKVLESNADSDGWGYGTTSFGLQRHEVIQ